MDRSPIIHFLAIVIAFLVTGCGRQTNVIRKKIIIPCAQKADNAPTKTPPGVAPPITVFVHGANVYPFTKSPHCFSGLHQITTMDKKYYYRQLAQQLNQADPQRFDLEHFYSYCWSGHLNYAAQKNDAQILNNHLKHMVLDYEYRYDQKPTICLIGFSHGCNLILNLAYAFSTENPIEIDRVIFLAPPVQRASAPLIEAPIFKKVYSFYSRVDFVQIIEPQRFHRHSTKTPCAKPPFFSQRRFTSCAKVKQARIKINGQSLRHFGFTKPRFLRSIPKIIDSMDEWNTCSPKQNSEYLLNITIKKLDQHAHQES